MQQEKGAYDVGDNYFAVKVDADTKQADAGAEPLGLAAEGVLLDKGRQRVADQDPLGRVVAGHEVVLEHLLDELLGGLLVVLGDFLKGLVGGHKRRDVVLGRVQGLDNVRVLVDQLGKLGRVLRGVDGLVDGVVGPVVGIVVSMVALVAFAGVLPLRGEEVGDLEIKIQIRQLVDNGLGVVSDGV